MNSNQRRADAIAKIIAYLTVKFKMYDLDADILRRAYKYKPDAVERELREAYPHLPEGVIETAVYFAFRLETAMLCLVNKNRGRKIGRAA